MDLGQTTSLLSRRPDGAPGLSTWRCETNAAHYCLVRPLATFSARLHLMHANTPVGLDSNSERPTRWGEGVEVKGPPTRGKWQFRRNGRQPPDRQNYQAYSVRRRCRKNWAQDE